MLSLLLACFLLARSAEIKNRVECGSSNGTLPIDTSLGPVAVYGMENKRIGLLPADNLSRSVLSEDIVWIEDVNNKVKVTQNYKRLWVTFTREMDTALVKYKTLNYTSGWIKLHLGKAPVLRLLNSTASTLEVSANDSDTITVCFTLSGAPPPRISLYHTSLDGSRSKVNKERYNVTRKQDCLEFGPANQQDTGTLTVNATNCFGSSNLFFSLNVSSQSKLHQQTTTSPVRRQTTAHTSEALTSAATLSNYQSSEAASTTLPNYQSSEATTTYFTSNSFTDASQGPTSQEKTTTNISLWVYIVIGVGAVILLGLLVILIYLKFCKKDHAYFGQYVDDATKSMSWVRSKPSNIAIPTTAVYEEPDIALTSYANTGSLHANGSRTTAPRTNSPVGYETVYSVERENVESPSPYPDPDYSIVGEQQVSDKSTEQATAITASSPASYASIDPLKKTERKAASQYSQVDIERKKQLQEVIKYAHLDQSALEQAAPPRPRFNLVDYTDVNEEQPKTREEIE